MSRRRPTLETANALAGALRDLLMGRHIDKLWRTGRDQLLIRFAGQKRRLLVQVSVDHATLAWVSSWPETPQAPDFETIQLRAHLEGGRIADIALVEERRLVFSLTRGDGARQLSVQLAGRFPNLAALDDKGPLGVALRQDRPHVDEGSPPLRAGHKEPEGDDGEAWLERHGEGVLEALRSDALERARVALARVARAWRKRTQRSLEAVGRDLERAENAEKDRVFGELLKGALGRLRKGAVSAHLIDYTQPEAPEVEIPLDPSLAPVENMQRYFRRYRKFRDAQDTILDRHIALSERLESIDEVLDAIAAAKEEDALQQAETSLRASGWRPPRAQKPRAKVNATQLPYRRFLTLDGAEVLVGRGSKHNDALTFRVGRGRDLWFHARDTPGAHVILRAPQKGSPSHESILDAATLAGWHSKARGEAVIDVIWTERKHVKKPKGAPPGRVTIADGKNVAVRMDKARVDRLYASAPDA